MKRFPEASSLSVISPQLIEALKDILPSVPLHRRMNNQFPIEKAVNLTSTYNLSKDQFIDICRAVNLHLDIESYEKKLEESSGQLTKKNFKDCENGLVKLKNLPPTDVAPIYSYRQTLCYDDVKHSTDLVSIIKFDNKNAPLISSSNEQGTNACLLLRSTNFYPSAGGQCCDRGIIEGSQGVFEVNNVYKFEDYILHSGNVTSGNFQQGDKVTLTIDKRNRLKASKHHSVHHLLMASIRHVTGE